MGETYETLDRNTRCISLRRINPLCKVCALGPALIQRGGLIPSQPTACPNFAVALSVAKLNGVARPKLGTWDLLFSQKRMT